MTDMLVARPCGNVQHISRLATRSEDQPEIERHATIACIIPAYNEEHTIADVMTSLLTQTRPPDVIHVFVNNTDDNTLEVLKPFIGRHQRVVKGIRYQPVVQVHDIGSNPDKKVGALNYGYRLARSYDYVLGVDGDTTLDSHAVEYLELEMVDDPRIGGLSAIYSIDQTKISGGTAKFLVAGQRAQFAAFNLDNLLHGRNMAVLGGQCSLFSVAALEAVMALHHQRAPWVRDSEVEDSKLSLQIKDAGFSTKISSRARAFVGPMTDLRGLHGQQVKWTYGSIDLLWPGQRGDTKGQPMHPNLRLRWFENVSMLFNIATRMAFLLLLFAALNIHAFIFNPVWLIPPVVAVGLNLRIALAMHDKSKSDLCYALGVLPAEAYMWVRMGHFMTSWAQFFSRVEKDNWAAQASAENGRGKRTSSQLLGRDHLRNLDLCLGPAVGRRTVSDSVSGMADPLHGHNRANPVHGQEVPPPSTRVHRLNLESRSPDIHRGVGAALRGSAPGVGRGSQQDQGAGGRRVVGADNERGALRGVAG